MHCLWTRTTPGISGIFMVTSTIPETQRRERFLIAQPEDLDQNLVYAKERRLVEICEGGAGGWQPLLPRVRCLYQEAGCDADGSQRF